MKTIHFTETECMMAAIAIMSGSDKTAEELISSFRAAKSTPLGQAMHGASSMAMLEASDADAVALRGDAMEHAHACLRACGGWTVETLGHNIQSAFGMDLSDDECDEIARAAMQEQ